MSPRPKASEYSYNELRVLHLLKRGPIARTTGESLYHTIADMLSMKSNTLRYVLNVLEKKCVILRTYKRPKANSFGSDQGNNPLLKVELVDPKMTLPPAPKPPSLGTVIHNENVEMEHTHEPERDHVIEALVDRALELQTQVNRLQTLVEALTDENNKLKKAKRENTERPAHLSQRVRDALTPEQWSELERRTD